MNTLKCRVVNLALRGGMEVCDNADPQPLER